MPSQTPIDEPVQYRLPEVEELRSELALLKSSREFQWGSRLRQSLPFRWLRHMRLKNSLVRVRVSGVGAATSYAPETTLLGVWYDEYPDGLPLELLERSLKKWRQHPDNVAPYGQAIYTTQPDEIYIYTQDENLRFDFQTNPGSGQIELLRGGEHRVVDLHTAGIGVVSVYPNRRPMDVIFKSFEAEDTINVEEESRVEAAAGQPALLLLQREQIAARDLEWLAAQQAAPRPLSINHPQWRGILASARELFDNLYLVPDDLDRKRADYYARLFIESGVPSLTIQGFPKTYIHLVKALRRLASRLPLYVIYHGNFLHMREDYDWQVLKEVIGLHRSGEIAKIGFVKQGMAEIMNQAGIRSAFISNLVRQVPEGPSQPLDGGPHIGIWAQPDGSWKKSPYAMLAALKMLPGAQGHAYHVSHRAEEFAGLLHIPAEYSFHALAQAQVPEAMQQMHLNLYVTLTECAPMMPLESLSTGSPCLFGPTTHYFQDHAYLRQRLVVPIPDDALTIANTARKALEERREIIDAYQNYAPEYNQRALQALAEFLEFPVE